MKPQINAKLYESFIKNCCGSLHRTTVTSVDAVHTYASARAYVGASSRGATLNVWVSPYVGTSQTEVSVYERRFVKMAPVLQ